MKKLFILGLLLLPQTAFGAMHNYVCGEFFFTGSGSGSCTDNVWSGNRTIYDESLFPISNGTYYVSFTVYSTNGTSPRLNCVAEPDSCPEVNGYIAPTSGEYVDIPIVTPGESGGIAFWRVDASNWSIGNICVSDSPNECRPEEVEPTYGPSAAITDLGTAFGGAGTILGIGLAAILIGLASLFGLAFGITKLIKYITGPSWDRSGQIMGFYYAKTPYKGYNRWRSKKWNMEHTA